MILIGQGKYTNFQEYWHTIHPPRKVEITVN